MTTRRRRAAQILLGLVVVVVALASGSGAEPADAQEVPEGCRRIRDEHTVVGEGTTLTVYPQAGHFLRCDAEHGSDCFETESASIPSGTAYDDNDGTNEHFYCTTGDTEWVKCHNDIRWSWGGADVDDDESAFFSGDDEGYVVVPSDPPEGIAWWVDELVAENGLATDSDFEGGQGCAVAANYPEHASCDQINERKEELRGEVSSLEARQEAQEQGYNNEGIDPDRLREARSELHGLENVGGLIPDDCFGTYPSDRYTISWSNADDEDGDEEMASSNRIMGWLATIIFTIGKSAVVIMLWLVRLGFTFDINEYRIAVGDFASRLDRNIVHLGDADLSLFDMAWFALFAYAGTQALRGRVGRAAGEIGMAIVLATIGVVLIGNFFPYTDDGDYRSSVDGESNAYEEGSYFDSVGGLINASSLAMLRVANPETSAVDVGGHPAHNRGEPPVDLNISGDDMDRQEVEDLIRDTNGRLHMEFIERPYYYINYGRDEFDEEPAEGIMDGCEAVGTGLIPDDDDLDDEYGNYTSTCYQVRACSEVVQRIHSLNETNPSWVRRFMRRNGCGEMSEWNQVMNSERLMAATLVTAVALVVAICLSLAAITLLILKFLVAVLFVALPIAVVMAILPGRSRSLGFGWATSLLQLWLAAIGTSMILAVVLMGVDAVNATSQDQSRPLAERWTMILLVVMTLFILRKRIVSGSQSVANTLQDRLTASTGDTANWGGGGGAKGRMNDMDLAGVDRGAARAGMAGRLAMLAGGAWAARTGFGVARSAWHMGPGGIRRSVVSEYGRRRSAALSQAWHWRNTQESQRLGQARDIKRDPSKSREGVLKNEFGKDQNGRVKGNDPMRYLGDARVGAAVAHRDVDLLEKADVSRKTRNTGEAYRAFQRFGGRAQQWHDPTARAQVLEGARQQRDRLVRVAGGADEVAKVRPQTVNSEVQSLNARGPNQRTHESMSDDLARRHQVADNHGRATTEVGDRLRELRGAGVQSLAEADAKTKEHNM